jgi:polyisoprenoid-binding protein YceI
MKIQIFAALAAVLLLGIVGCTGPADNQTRADIGDQTATTDTEGLQRVNLNTEEATFNFTGYGPGKSHEGTFNDWDATLLYEEDQLVGAEVTVNVASLDTGIGGLDNHLRSEDFFDTQEHPEATFTTTSIQNGQATGSATMKGITRTLEFPLNITENSVATEFVIDLTAFNISHPAANDEVLIEFNTET